MRTLSLRLRILVSVPALGAAALSAGCGNLNSRSAPLTAAASSYRPGSSGYQDTSANGGHPELTDYACPSAANVTDKANYSVGGANQYTVCTSKKNTNDVAVFGTPGQTGAGSATPKICFFPVDKVSDQNIYYKPVSTTNTAPIHACVAWSPSGMKYSFGSMQFNAAIIVTEPRLEEMKQFLVRFYPNIAYASDQLWPAGSATGSFR